MKVKELKDLLNNINDDIDIKFAERSPLGSHYKINKFVKTEIIDNSIYIIINFDSVKVIKELKKDICIICGKYKDILISTSRGLVCDACSSKVLSEKSKNEIENSALRNNNVDTTSK